MPKIKTREQVKDIKVLDKAAIAGQRMKNAAVRAKEQASWQGDGQDQNPNEYAGERVQGMARQTAQSAVRGTKAAVRKGKQAIPQKTEITPPAGPDTIRPAAMPAAPDVPIPGIMRPAVAPDTSDTPIADPIERGRMLAKRQAEQRIAARRQAENLTTVRPQIKTREAVAANEKSLVQSVPERRRTPRMIRHHSGTSVSKTEPSAKRTTAQATQLRQRAARRSFIKKQQRAIALRDKEKKAARGLKAIGKAVKRTIRAAAAATRNLIAMLSAGGGSVLLVVVMILLLGLLLGSCFGIFFSGHDSGTSQTMPMVVREIDQEFEDRIEAIQNETPHDSVEISASQARWPEVLAVYAVKTTTDPAHAQDVATVSSEKKALLKEIFWTIHEVSSYTTTSSHEVTSTIPNEAGGSETTTTTVTETTLHITITHRSADEMANEYDFSIDQRQQLHELLTEENRSLWTALLSGLGTGDDEIVSVALSQLGNRGGEPYWSWYGFTSRVNWCACFVSWCADQCGYLEADSFPKFSYCPAGIQWFKDAGLWQDRTFEPRPGDVVFFDWEADGTSDHVGIVEKVENGMVYTIEGNAGDACKQLSYVLGSDSICGFGTPNP